MVTQTKTIKVANGSIPILNVNDVVKDRLAAYFHWKDRQSLVQAMAILIKHQMEPTGLSDFCVREAGDVEFELIKMFYRQAKQQNVQSMLQLEALLTQILIKRL